MMITVQCCMTRSTGSVQLFLKDVTDIVKSVPIMSFLVIIASLIAFMILIIIEKIIFFIESEQVGRYNIGSVSVISTYLK